MLITFGKSSLFPLLCLSMSLRCYTFSLCLHSSGKGICEAANKILVYRPRRMASAICIFAEVCTFPAQIGSVAEAFLCDCSGRVMEALKREHCFCVSKHSRTNGLKSVFQIPCRHLLFLAFIQMDVHASSKIPARAKFSGKSH